MNLLDVKMTRYSSAEDDCAYQKISALFSVPERKKVTGDNFVDIPIEDITQLYVNLKEPISFEDLAKAFESLAEGIRASSNVMSVE